MSELIVLFDGFSLVDNDEYMTANCTCTLIKGQHNIIVDTMTPWDSEKILTGLKQHGISPNDIDFVISTHGHSDHTGNNNLFLKAKHIVGFSISFQEKYYLHDFDKGTAFVINNDVQVVPTPGHTLSDVTVLVKINTETFAIAGDLFERYEDVDNPRLWMDAGSENPKLQMKNRIKIAEVADWIIPGHGPKFQVNDQIRDKLRKQFTGI